jgi:hypothetical protein
VCPATAGGAAGRWDRPGPPGDGAGAAAYLPGRLRLPGLRPHGRPARPRPLLPHPRPGRVRPGLLFHRLAAAELSLRAAVYPRQLRPRAAGAQCRAVDGESASRPDEPAGGLADGAGSRAGGALGCRGGSLRRPEPGPAGSGRGRRPQRHAAAGGVGGGAGADGRRTRLCSDGSGRGFHASAGGALPSTRCRAGAGCRRRSQADGRPGPALPRARTLAMAGTGSHRGRRRAGPAGRPGDRAGRLRTARLRLPERDRRRAAAGRDALDPRRDGQASGPGGDAVVVAAAVGRGLRRRARLRAVADRPGGRLADSGGLDDAGPAAGDGLAAALVCSLAAAASRRQRPGAPARGRALALRLRHPDPRGAG